jgi:hypothetical protein
MVFPNVSSVLDHFVQRGKFVSIDGDKQELHLWASRTNLLRHLKAVELGHDDIPHRKIYYPIVLVAQAQCLHHRRQKERKIHSVQVSFAKGFEECYCPPTKRMQADCCRTGAG